MLQRIRAWLTGMRREPLQRALDALEAVGGGTICLKRDQVVTKTVRVPANVCLTGTILARLR